MNRLLLLPCLAFVLLAPVAAQAKDDEQYVYRLDVTLAQSSSSLSERVREDIRDELDAFNRRQERRDGPATAEGLWAYRHGRHLVYLYQGPKTRPKLECFQRIRGVAQVERTRLAELEGQRAIRKVTFSLDVDANAPARARDQLQVIVDAYGGGGVIYHRVEVGDAGDHEVTAYVLTDTRDATRLVRLPGVDDLVVEHKKTIE